jgi:hypothetical protein
MFDTDLTREEIHEIVCDHHGAFFQSINPGAPASQGETNEIRMFNVKRNNGKAADFKGVEIKTSAKVTKPMRPFTFTMGCENLLRSDYGSLNGRGDKQCFNQSFRAISDEQQFTKSGKPKKKRAKTKVTHKDGTVTHGFLTRADGHINLVFGDVVIGKVAESVIQDKLDEKMSDMCIFVAAKRYFPVKTGDTVEDIEHFNYSDYTFHHGFSSVAFWREFDLGNIPIEFRLRGVENKGTCFRITRTVLKRLYEHNETRADYEARRAG